MDVRTTKEDNDSKGGLNDGNPDRDRTPIHPREEINLVGGTTQYNYEDEIAGTAPEATRENDDSSASRH
jgi:hypothetical protein